MISGKQLLIIGALVISNSAIASEKVDGLGVKYSKDTDGQRFLNDLTLQVNSIQSQIEALQGSLITLQSSLDDKQDGINYVKRVDNMENFTVSRGSFKLQLAHFADRLGIETIRWSGVPSCTDWQLDSSYKINLRDTENAIDEFLDGMPLSFQYFERDNSLNITSLVAIGGCGNEK